MQLVSAMAQVYRAAGLLISRSAFDLVFSAKDIYFSHKILFAIKVEIFICVSAHCTALP